MKIPERLFRRCTSGRNNIQQQLQPGGYIFLTFIQFQHSNVSLFRVPDPLARFVEERDTRVIAKKEMILTFCQKHDRSFINALLLLKYAPLSLDRLYHPEPILYKTDFLWK